MFVVFLAFPTTLFSGWTRFTSARKLYDLCRHLAAARRSDDFSSPSAGIAGGPVPVIRYQPHRRDHSAPDDDVDPDVRGKPISVVLVGSIFTYFGPSQHKAASQEVANAHSTTLNPIQHGAQRLFSRGRSPNPANQLKVERPSSEQPSATSESSPHPCHTANPRSAARQPANHAHTQKPPSTLPFQLLPHTISHHRRTPPFQASGGGCALACSGPAPPLLPFACRFAVRRHHLAVGVTNIRWFGRADCELRLLSELP